MKRYGFHPYPSPGAALVLGLLAALVLGFLVFGSEASAEEVVPAGSFYQWENERGTYSATDALKNVPTNYREQAVLRTFAAVRQATQAQVTPMAEPAVVRIPTLRPFAGVDPMPLFAPAHTERVECDQPVTVESRRVQQGRYNRTLYFVTNSCGELISVTPQTPWVDISIDGNR
jgi:hypothetical protein